MGVFVPSSPFTDFTIAGLFTFSSTEQLFLMGAVAIAVGVMTYSKRVMMTVGGGIMPLSPVAAWVVVMAHSIVLFLFASQGLEQFLASHGLPTIPLVPVSSSQAVVGAVLGIAILKGGRGIRWRVLGGIGAGWVAAPAIAGVVCFIGLYFMQNVFDQKVQSAGLGADDQKSMVRSAPLPNDRLYNRIIVDTEIYNVSQNGRAN
jgi:PiT family inorganic phosphate transporter